jgi:glucokinase
MANRKTRKRSITKDLKLVLAVDIGGTKVEAGLVTERGEVAFSVRHPMAAQSTADAGLRAVRKAIDEVMLQTAAARAAAIGIAVPGWVNAREGKILKTANLPCWENYPLAKKIAGHYRLRTRLENDASAAAIAEARWGAGRAYDSLFYVSLGTGIGTGIVRRGSDGGLSVTPSEGGHMSINFEGPLCGCGKRGCVEMYASGKALARRAKSVLAGGATSGSKLAKFVRASGREVNAEMIARAAKAGDKVARGILEEACDFLCVWLGNIIDLMEPEAIVIGGGLGPLMYTYLPRIRRQLRVHSIHPGRSAVRIHRARFGSQSALLGAAALWLESPEMA